MSSNGTEGLVEAHGLGGGQVVVEGQCVGCGEQQAGEEDRQEHFIN